MAITPRQWLDTATRARAARQWSSHAEAAESMPPGRLRGLRAEAETLRADLDRLIATARRRAETGFRGTALPGLPPGTDWHWRPTAFAARLAAPGLAGAEGGARLGDEVALWHDCPDRAVIATQHRIAGRETRAPYGLTIETLAGSAGYLSLSVDLPAAATDGLTRGHVLQLDLSLVAERPRDAYLRLNIEHGPDTETMLHPAGRIEADSLPRYRGLRPALCRDRRDPAGQAVARRDSRRARPERDPHGRSGAVPPPPRRGVRRNDALYLAIDPRRPVAGPA